MTQVKRATRKIYLSIIFVTLSLLTMVATTFAWVSIVSNASFERFTINLETDNEKSDYGVMLSLTGKTGDFHDSLDSTDVQRQILKNMNVENVSSKSDVAISTLFNQIKLSQCTTVKDFDDTVAGSQPCYELDPFLTLEGRTPYATLNGKETNYSGYFEFDIWVSIYKIGSDDDSGSGSEKKLSIYLRNGDSDGILSSDTCSAYISNEIIMPDETNPLTSQYLKAVNNFSAGKKIKGEVKIKAASAARLSVQKAKAVDIGDNTNYYNNAYRGLKIFKYGGNVPSYDSKYDLYDFGGILPTDFNFARLVYNSVRNNSEGIGEVPQMALPEKRGDVTFVDDGVVNHIVDETDNVKTTDMIKLHFNYWFEGWDSDCFEAINDKPVTVNLNFSTKNPNDV